MTVFMDGARLTPGTADCHCGSSCEMPCWQRLGLTEEPCCKACGPLGDVAPVSPLPDMEATGAVSVQTTVAALAHEMYRIYSEALDGLPSPWFSLSPRQKDAWVTLAQAISKTARPK